MSGAKPMFDVIGVGAMNLDVVLDTQPLIAGVNQWDGYTEEHYTAQREGKAGGSAANTIHGLGTLGLTTAFVGVVGTDSAAEVLLDSFREAGVDTSMIAATECAPTAEALCITFDGDERIIVPSDGANGQMCELLIPKIEDTVRTPGHIIHFSSMINDSATEYQKDLALAYREKNSGVLLSASPGRPYAERFSSDSTVRALFQELNYLFVNDEELEMLLASGTPNDFMIEHPKLTALAVTHGEGKEVGSNYTMVGPGGTRGSYANRTVHRQTATLHVQNEQDIPIIDKASLSPDCIVDAIGAGDSFAAGVLYGLRRYHGDLIKSGYSGLVAAKATVQHKGARNDTRTPHQHHTDLEKVLNLPKTS